MEDSDILTILSVEDLNNLPCSEKGNHVLDLRHIEVGMEGSALDRCLIATRLLDHIKETTTSQVWLPNNESFFYELINRIEKLGGKAWTRKLTLHPSYRQAGEAYQIGKQITDLYQSMDNLKDLQESHPSLHRLLDKSVKNNQKLNKNKIKKIGPPKVMTQNTALFTYTNNKRQLKRSAVVKIKNFNKKALENQQELTQKEDFNNKHHKCYMCKTNTQISMTLCQKCTEINNKMLNSRINLLGRFAVVTGARIKIGFEVSLRLLRDGCFVIATTRFPGSAMHAYSTMKDFDEWKDRLKIVQLDLLDLPSIERFVTFVEKEVPHLDILINNAAQTISRPAAYYRSLCEQEEEFYLHPPAGYSNIIQKIHPYVSLKLYGDTTYEPPAKKIKPTPQSEMQEMKHSTSQTKPLNKNMNVLSQASKWFPVSQVDEHCKQMNSQCTNSMSLSLTGAPLSTTWFPAGQVDEHGEQLDSRPINSWSLGLTGVPLAEFLQVLAVNSVAPFLLTSRLTPLLKKSPQDRKFVINVSAMEGQFSRSTKGHRHPHTNMAKAALNMMTRTSGLELQLDQIYMTAVDTGWCTDERPLHQANHEKIEKGFRVPLSCQDGSARVYHPIIHGLQQDNQPYFSVFLKDYKVHPW